MEIGLKVISPAPRATSLRADVENLLDIERIGAAGNGIELIFSQFTLEVCRVLIVLRRC